MMTESYIVGRMVHWAKYSLRGVDGGIGYKRKCAWAEQSVHGGGLMDYTPYIDEDGNEIDKCVIALSIERPELYAIVNLQYKTTTDADGNKLTAADKYNRAGCSKSTYHDKVTTAHNLILGWLNDLSCNIKIPSNLK